MVESTVGSSKCNRSFIPAGWPTTSGPRSAVKSLTMKISLDEWGLFSLINVKRGNHTQRHSSSLIVQPLYTMASPTGSSLRSSSTALLETVICLNLLVKPKIFPTCRLTNPLGNKNDKISNAMQCNLLLSKSECSTPKSFGFHLPVTFS